MRKKILVFCSTIMITWCSLFGAIGTPVFASTGCNTDFLGFRAWYKGLVNGNCDVDMNNFQGQDGLARFVWTIILNITFDLSLVAGILATGFMIFGGYLYITSEGDPGKVSKGKTTIRNAAIGIVVAIAAAVITNTIMVILSV